MLRNHSGVDFSLYKLTTLERRIARRILINKLNALDDYVPFLRNNAKELAALYSDMLISVTSFFRNPEAFDVLKYKVFPQLLAQHGEDPIRVWVLGCSTGQEAYSIAMVFTEAAENVSRARQLQIFATDLNDTLLDRARQGLYSRNLVEAIPPERLRRFFTEEDGGYRINKAVRERVVFAHQNVINDPPFSRVHLISCRNLLIYLESDAQRKVLSAFHYALKPEGFLFLGASESVGNFADLFDSFDKTNRIYSKKRAPERTLAVPTNKVPMKQEESATGVPATSQTKRSRYENTLHGELNPQREFDRIAVNRFAPPCVLVDAEHQVLQFRGATGAFLQPPSGKATFDLLKMAREGLMLPLRAAFHKARKENKIVRQEGVRFRMDGKVRSVNIEVSPLKNLKEPYFLVAFEGLEPESQVSTVPLHEDPSGSESSGDGEEGARRIADLESELSETREYLQSVHERQEVVNEELQASNEEIQSANEELQSINEELQTSKEELESTNEELTTINEEMASRNSDLSRLSNDLINIQTSARLPIVLLGRDLTIRRFSAEAENHFSLMAADIGRSFRNVRHNLFSNEEQDASPLELEDLIADVIATAREQERQIRDAEGRWYSLRIRPYLTLDNIVDGAVLVLMDISDLKHTEQRVSAARDYAEAIIRTIHDPLIILDADFRIHTANDAFYRLFRLSPDTAQGSLIYELGNRQWRIPKLRSLLEEILPRKSFFNDFELTSHFDNIGRRTLLLDGRILDLDGEPSRILLGIRDVTETLSFQIVAREEGEKFKILFEHSPLPKWTIDPATLRFLNVNQEAITNYGYSRDEFSLMTLNDIIAPETQEGLPQATLQPWQRFPENTVVQHLTKDGKRIVVEVRTNEITIAGQRAWLASMYDISEIHRAERALQTLNEELRRADHQKNEFLAVLGHELRTPLSPIQNGLDILRLTRDLTPEARAAKDMMDRQVRQMVQLVDDLLDASRISRGKIELRKQVVDLGSVLHQSVEAGRALFESKQLRVTVSLTAKPILINADPLRLGQAIGNLLNNAAKFTDNGGSISLSAEAALENGQAVVRVQDSGIGIEPGQHERIFEMFTQLETSLDRSQSGLGIGLALSKKLLELHDGTLEVQSGGVGHGTEFILRLPMADEGSSADPEPVLTHLSVPAQRILIVDDNADAADSMSILLEMEGHETSVARDGLQAIDVAEEFKPDAILLDIGLPKLNGYDTARRIREYPWGKQIVLVALTGRGQDADRQKSREAGFDTHFVKPVDHLVLMKFLADIPGRAIRRS